MGERMKRLCCLLLIVIAGAAGAALKPVFGIVDRVLIGGLGLGLAL